MLWSFLSERTRIPLGTLIRAAREAAISDSEQRQKSVAFISRCLSDALRQPGCFVKMGRNCLIFIYLFIKLLQIGTVAIHLNFIRLLTAISYSFYGLELLIDLILGTEWQKPQGFPFVIWCDFEVQKLGSINRHSIMCGIF